ncbi:hypothetical protein E1576_09535 [Salmonella enterica subsp. enterica serovar Braenderup]|nr:hypothetical protein [Salmonella enterica subsp. enterica serovar Braenderup]EDU9683050.1 hypothetical protein [Salmonella enterica subsp. enterica serovar Braenderup]
MSQRCQRPFQTGIVLVNFAGRIESAVHDHVCRECVGRDNGSGYYDHNGSPKCSSCNGTGKERYKPN